MNQEDLYHCRVCGLRFDDPPWGTDGKTPSYDICPCCGAEFGFDDDKDASGHDARSYREQWLAGGARWHHPKAKPEDWDLEKQLNQIPGEYR